MSMYRVNLTRIPLGDLLKQTGLVAGFLLSPVILFCRVFRVPVRRRERIRGELEFIQMTGDISEPISARRSYLAKIGLRWLGQFEIRGLPATVYAGFFRCSQDTVLSVIVNELPVGEKVTVEVVSGGRDGTEITTTTAAPGILNRFPPGCTVQRVPADWEEGKIIETHRKLLLKTIPKEVRLELETMRAVREFYETSYVRNIEYWRDKGYIQEL